MPNELENLLAQPMVPCPHCGTPNGADSETCLCCGGRMQETAVNEKESPAQNEVMPVVSAVAAAEPGGAPDADEPPPLTPAQKRTRRILFGLITVCNVLLLAAVLVYALYINAPGYRAAKLFQDEEWSEAQYLYTQDVVRDELQSRIMRREMRKYSDELDAQYRDGELDFRDYTTIWKNILRMYLDEELTRDVKERFHAELEVQYDSYIRTILGEEKVYYIDVYTAFSSVIDNNLAPDDRTKALFAQLQAIYQDEKTFKAAQDDEQAKNYKKAITKYRQIQSYGPRAAEAAEGMNRCVTAYCADIRAQMAQLTADSGTFAACRRGVEDMLSAWPDNDALTQLYNEAQNRYKAALKREALEAAEHPAYGNRYIVQALRRAMNEWPGDAELQAACDRYTPTLKAELPGELLHIIQDANLGWDEALSYADSMRALLPDDADIAELYERMERFINHRLYLDGMDTGVEDLFKRHMESESSAWYEYNTEPVVDTFGVLHEPYALYRFTAATTKPAVFLGWGNDFNTLRFKVFADPKCTGSGHLELWMIRSAGDDSRWEKYWTSPVLDCTTNGLEVNIPFPDQSFTQFELQLVSDKGTVVMLLDEAYAE
jgi:hypothetical protein